MSKARSLIAPVGGTPLTILAGIPDDAAEELQQRLVSRYRCNQDGRPRRDFHPLTGGKEGGRYSKHTVQRTVIELAERILLKYRKSEKEKKFNPCHISLVYLSPKNQHEEDLLIDYFFLFCRCIPIQQVNAQWNKYPCAELANLFVNAIETMSTWSDKMRSRYFNLPVRNFYIAEDMLLKQHCIERIKENNQLFPIDNRCIKFNKCNDKSKCSACYRGMITRIPIDIRGLCFVPGAEHGLPHIDNLMKNSPRHAQILLEGLYRFGQPIAPGSQSDVQFEQGRSLQSVSFMCTVNGEVKGNGRYVNIYTNDFIRFPVSK